MPHQYRFGEFKILPTERLLFRRGVEQALTARAFEMLMAFVERAGQLVAKDELLKRVWGGLVVEENNLAVQVGVLRKVLGPEAITTIPGFGYRFALEVLQVDDDGPRDSAPPARGNLPMRLPSLIGRQAELDQAAALLAAHPLLTICGGPGLGKTRLAQELAQRQRELHADGVWWVDLTLLRDGESPALALARRLGVAVDSDPEPAATLTRRLASTTMLIVLDNAEHRIEEVAALATALVRDTAHTRLVVTSQVPLRAPAERLMRLAPLDEADAVRLLAERAGVAAWDGAAGEQAASICRALDSNALAIELAAARLDALGLDGLADRLHQRLTLLAPGEAARSSRGNALAAAMDWAHELLGERDRRVLRRLGVFPAGFTLELAALVLADDSLPAARAVEAVLSLVERSLVAVERGSRRRFRLLETTRLYALDRLAAAGETDAAQAAFFAGVRWLVEDAYEESWRTPPREWRARYEPELHAVWAALDWAIRHDVEGATALFGASAPIWRQLDVASLARACVPALAERVTDAVPAAIRARFWLACAYSYTMLHPGLARPAAERAAGLYRDQGQALGEYQALVEYAFNWRVDVPEARAALARAQSLQDPGWPAAVIERGLTSEAVIHMSAGRNDAARACYLRALEVSERDGFDRGVRRALLNLADLERAAGRLDEAVQLGQALRQRLQGEGSTESLETVLGNLMGALLEQGRHEAAREAALELQRHLGRLRLEESGWITMDALALLHLHDGRVGLASQLAGAADAAFEAHGQPQRQPNEAKDRAALAAGLARHLPLEEIERLRAEGRRMDPGGAIARAFDLGLSPSPGTGA